SSHVVEPYDTFPGKSRWCTNCAPAVPHPLPPLPAGVGVETRDCGQCATGHCAAGDRTCWHKVKDWLCFRYTPVHFPCLPTPKEPALYTYFPCEEGPGCGSTGCAAGKSGHRMPGRG